MKPKLKQIELRLPKDVLDRITEIAKAAGVTRTQAINTLLATYIRKERA